MRSWPRRAPRTERRPRSGRRGARRRLRAPALAGLALALLGAGTARAQQGGTACLGPFPPPVPATSYGASLPFLRALGVPDAHRLGFTGAGVRIAVLDAGFRTDHESLAPLRVAAARDFVDGDDVVDPQPGDPAGGAERGTRFWSVLAGCAAQRLIGPAFGAEFLLARVDDPAAQPRADEDRWIAALDWAESQGARIVASPLGFRVFDDGPGYPVSALTGTVAASSRAVDAAAARGVLVVGAVGGEEICGAVLCVPADAREILSVGAVDGAGRRLSGSGLGPTADGRIKPELVAPGDSVPVAASSGTAVYARQSGPLAAAPLVAGAAALVLEAWPGMTAAELRLALERNTPRRDAPANGVGRGVPNAAWAILFPRGLSASIEEGVAEDGTLTTLSPRFSWSAPLLHPLAEPAEYRLEVALDSTFERVLHADTAPDGAASLALDHAVPPTDALWWRIVARTAAGIERPTPPVGPLVVPHWVRLRTFGGAAGEFTLDPRPELVWSPLPAPPPVGPLVYEVQVIEAETGFTILVMPEVRDTAVTLPTPLAYNTPYRWRVIARAADGSSDTVESTAPFVVVNETRPPITMLHQNFPNPFPRWDLGKDATRIWFDLAEAGAVHLAVYDLRGRLVRRLIPGPGCGAVRLEPGLYGRGGEDGDPCIVTEWDGRDDAGRPVPRGVYLLRLRADGRDLVKRVLYLPGGK